MSTPASRTAAAEPLDSNGDMERSPFLSEPPRSGQMSPFAQKIAAEFIIWLASIVVFGSTIDFSTSIEKCNILCGLSIASGVISFFATSSILVGHYLIWSLLLTKNAWMSSSAELHYMIALVLLWTVGVSVLSAYKGVGNLPVPHTSRLAIAFGWLAFFSSIFGAYKAYHSQKEEQKNLIYQQNLSMQQAEEEEEYANFS